MWYISTVWRQHRNEKKKKKSQGYFANTKFLACWYIVSGSHTYSHRASYSSLVFSNFVFVFPTYVNFIFSLHNIVSLHVKFCREIAGNLDFRFFVHKHLCSFFFFPRKLPKFKYKFTRYKIERIATIKEPKKFKKVQNKERHRKTDWNKIFKGKEA